MGPARFSLFRDSAGATAWTGAGTLTIGVNGTGTLSQAVYGRLQSGQQQVPPGAYQSNGFALVSYGLTPACGTAMSAPVLAVLNYPASCHIYAQPMTFSPNGLLSSATDAATSLSATCSNSSPYNVLLDGGQAAVTDPTQRKLSFGGYQITYGLYQNAARSIPWGSTIGSNTAAGTGNGQTQTLIVYGRIPAQPTPPPATYQDLITVTISY